MVEGSSKSQVQAQVLFLGTGHYLSPGGGGGGGVGGFWAKHDEI